VVFTYCLSLPPIAERQDLAWRAGRLRRLARANPNESGAERESGLVVRSAREPWGGTDLARTKRHLRGQKTVARPRSGQGRREHRGKSAVPETVRNAEPPPKGRADEQPETGHHRRRVAGQAEHDPAIVDREDQRLPRLDRHLVEHDPAAEPREHPFDQIVLAHRDAAAQEQ